MEKTVYNHVELGIVDLDGNVNVLYPITQSRDVSIEMSNGSIPSGANTVQRVIDKLGDLAFNSGESVVYLDESEESDSEVPNSEIDDGRISSAYTWSSKKLEERSVDFIPAYLTSVDTLNQLPIRPTFYNVDSQDMVYRSYCPPIKGRYKWFVTYIPFTISDDPVGNVTGAVKSVMYAVERWIGHEFSDGKVNTIEYERVYMNGAWQGFMKIR